MDSEFNEFYISLRISKNPGVFNISSAYPYVTELKKPQWYPFGSIKNVPDFYIPYYDLVIKFYDRITKQLFRIPDLNLENLYWYVILGRFLKVDLKKSQIEKKIQNFIKDCEIEDDTSLGFKFSPNAKEKHPDVFSTAFALVILKTLNLLNSYIDRGERGNVKNKIRKFILSSKNKKGFQHCLKNCSICKKTTEYRVLYSVLESLLVLDGTVLPLRKEILPSLSNPSKPSAKNLFRLIDLKFFSSYESIEDEELNFFQNFQREDGGFNFSSLNGTMGETFWIAFMFENYSFLTEYHRGRLYSFLINNLKKIDVEKDTQSSLKLMEYSKLIIILAFVWKNLINELENIIFSYLSQSPIIGINELTHFVRDAEYEIIAFINLKYNLTLNISDNKTRFGQFYSRLDSIEKKFAKIIFENSKRYVRIDLTELLNKYNKNIQKKHRVQPEIVVKLVNRMVAEYFFKGQVVRKKRVFGQDNYSFNRAESIPKVITCDRIINFDDILKEKRKLETVSEDIFNMTREMKNSSKIIMYEVESLIFVDEIEYAEKRLKNNIKKSLMDAEFFNKNVEQILDEFEYIKSQESLNDVIQGWKQVYNGLQSKFNNVNLIMKQKINESLKIQSQKDLLKEMENLVDCTITDCTISIDAFLDTMRKILDKNYSRINAKRLQDEINSHLQTIESIDKKIVENSQRIIAGDKKVRNKRKSIIEKWISNKKTFEEIFSFYQDGFSTCNDFLEKIDNFFNKNIVKIDEIKQNIFEYITDRAFANAFKLIDEGFEIIHKSINEESGKLQKDINSLLKHKKLYLIYNNLDFELKEKKKGLEERFRKIREELQNKVEIDKIRKLKEDYIKLVNEKIDFLEDSLENLEKQVNIMLSEGNIPNNQIIEDQFNILEKHHQDTISSIREQFKTCENNIPGFKNQVESVISKWNIFHTSFESRALVVKEKIIDDIIQKTLMTSIGRINSNKIDIIDVAEELQMDIKVVREKIVHMLNISKITGEFLTGTTIFMIHNNEWRINKRLKLVLDNEIKNINSIAERLFQLYETSIKSSSFTNNIPELIDLSTKFYSKNEKADLYIQQKINELKPIRENELFRDNYNYFEKNFKFVDKKVKNIIIKAENSLNVSNLINSEMESLIHFINLQLHKIDENCELKKTSTFIKNNDWLKGEYLKISEEVEEVKLKVYDRIDSIFNENGDTKFIKKEIRENFGLKINELIENFLDSQSELDEKIQNFEDIRIRKDLEKLLSSKQNILNNHLGKIQVDVENKIEIKEYKAAISKLQSKLSKIDLIIKKSEKELKAESKKIISSSKVFSVKNKYVFDNWDKFLKEYKEVIQEKQVNLELRIIEEYIQMVIKVFKDEYIPLNYLANEFNLKKNIIKERIISLIGEKKLEGKIYLEMEIYYENEDSLEKIDKNSVELIKTSGVNTFLLVNKIRRIALLYSPIIALIASILTVFFYLVQIIDAGYLIGAIIIIASVFSVILIVSWKRKTKKEQ